MLNVTFKQLLPMVKTDFASGNTPIILGEPGIGKSEFFEGLARELKTKVFTLSVNQLADRADLTGNRILEIEHNGVKQWEQSFFPHAVLMQAIRYATDHPSERPIVFLDEINRTSSDVTSAILSFTTAYRVGTIDFPENIVFAVAGNDNGNVVTLDSASMTRFSKYSVTPDFETFLRVVPQLNPFIKDTLTKKPGLLVADPLEIETVLGGAGPSDDDDDDNNSFLESFTTSGGDFEQLTRPRTIHKLSDWLNAAGIDKSGSDAELEVLTYYTTEQTTDDDQNSRVSLLEAAIFAKVGMTEFALSLHEAINDYYLNLVSSGVTATTSVATTEPLRPSQDIVNALAHATNHADADVVINGLDAESQTNLMLWLFDNLAVSELNNNALASHVVASIAPAVASFTPQQSRVLNALLNAPSSINQNSLNTFKTSASPAYVTWGPIISAIVGE